MIAVCPNPFRDNDLAVTKKICSMLRDNGFETVICPVFAESGTDVLPNGIDVARLSDVISDCTLAIVVGGDGTMLYVARSVFDKGVPLLGVNLGTKGFMAALEKEEIPLAVTAARGEARISTRMMIDVSLLRNGKTVYRDCALNDAVIHGYGECINITAWADGDQITRFSGDGVIIATPTGSTGYSMSAGGPIIEPDAENIIVNPICAHMMSARSFVLSPTRTVTVRTEKLHTRRAYLSVDGNSPVDVLNEDILVVTRSEHKILMANPGSRNFYEIVYTKLT